MREDRDIQQCVACPPEQAIPRLGIQNTSNVDVEASKSGATRTICQLLWEGALNWRNSVVVTFREELVEKATSYQIRTQSYKPDNDNSSGWTTMAYEEDESLAADEAAKKQGLADDHRSFSSRKNLDVGRGHTDL